MFPISFSKAFQILTKVQPLNSECFTQTQWFTTHMDYYYNEESFPHHPQHLQSPNGSVKLRPTLGDTSHQLGEQSEGPGGTASTGSNEDNPEAFEKTYQRL